MNIKYLKKWRAEAYSKLSINLTSYDHDIRTLIENYSKFKDPLNFMNLIYIHNSLDEYRGMAADQFCQANIDAQKIAMWFKYILKDADDAVKKYIYHKLAKAKRQHPYKRFKIKVFFTKRR